MAIIDSEILNTNLTKLKYYHNEELLNIDLLKKIFNDQNNMYISSNLNQIKEYENYLLTNLKIINQNHLANINVIEKTIYKYLHLEKTTTLNFNKIDKKMNKSQK